MNNFTWDEWVVYKEFCAKTGLPIEMSEFEQLSTIIAINQLKYEQD